MGRTAAVLVLAIAIASSGALAQSATDPSLVPVLQKVGDYVARYGERASLYVGVETYTQSVNFEGVPPPRPRKLVAEFAIVKAPGGAGWVGYRDVVEVNGDKVSDRRDRLVSILTDLSADSTAVIRLTEESARYNIGPVSRNFNVPTATMLFFQPANLSRFTFTRKGTKKIDGTETLELQFKETATPTLITTRAGANVPMQGSIWVVPGDGTVVRTKLVLEKFADVMSQRQNSGVIPQRPTVNPNVPTGGRDALAQTAAVDSLYSKIDSSADIEVTYSRHDQYGVWLPSKMNEVYAGPIRLTNKPPADGIATTRAVYSDFKQFDTGVKINIPK